MYRDRNASLPAPVSPENSQPLQSYALRRRLPRGLALARMMQTANLRPLFDLVQRWWLNWTRLGRIHV